MKKETAAWLLRFLFSRFLILVALFAAWMLTRGWLADGKENLAVLAVTAALGLAMSP